MRAILSREALPRYSHYAADRPDVCGGKVSRRICEAKRERHPAARNSFGFPERDENKVYNYLRLLVVNIFRPRR